MDDPVKRAANWEAKYNTESVKQSLDRLRPDMSKRYQAAVARLCIMENDVRQVLNAESVSTMLYVPYLNFGRQLYKLSAGRSIAGDSLALEAQVLLNKWAARGLNPDVLAVVRTQVFNISAPPAP
jgi:hypothetical protein